MVKNRTVKLCARRRKEYPPPATRHVDTHALPSLGPLARILARESPRKGAGMGKAMLGDLSCTSGRR